MTLNIIIADDHGIIRAGLRALLSAEPDIEVVGEAPDGDTALSLAAALQPDIILADMDIPGANAIEVTRIARALVPDTRVLIVTMYEDKGLLLEAMAAGAAGYISKRAVADDLIAAVRTVARGDTFMPPGWAAHAHPAVHQHRAGDLSDLTADEVEVVRYVARGHTNGQIARALGLSTEIVVEMRAALSKQLGLQNRAELVRYAVAESLI